MTEPPVAVAYRNRSDDLRITSVSRALVAWFKSVLASCSQVGGGGGRWLATAVRGDLGDTGTLDVMLTQRQGVPRQRP